jgi:hypothetical protein
MVHRDITAAWRAAWAGAALLAMAQAAQAQFDQAPAPVMPKSWLSQAQNDKAYRKDGARHLYANYGAHVYKGKLPPLMYAIAITETEIDGDGNVLNATIVRHPAAAKEVSPWVLEMIRKASPFPKPQHLARVRYFDVWLVDKSGKFQLDTLSEGQR